MKELKLDKYDSLIEKISVSEAVDQNDIKETVVIISFVNKKDLILSKKNLKDLLNLVDSFERHPEYFIQKM